MRIITNAPLIVAFWAALVMVLPVFAAQPELWVPWRGAARIIQGHHGPTSHDECAKTAINKMPNCVWENIYAIDIELPIGSDVLAPADGEVDVNWVIDSIDRSGGRQIALRHEGTNGTSVVTVFCHLSEIRVRSGKVVRGQAIAKSGASSEGEERIKINTPHLHFHLYRASGGRSYDSYTLPIERLFMKQVGVDLGFRDYSSGELEHDDIAGKTFESPQRNVALPAPSIASEGVVNAASFQGGPVAPGEVVTIFGANLGPSILSRLKIDSAGRLETNLTGTRVLFDGIPSPLIYSSAGQVSAIVPYGLTGKTRTQLNVEYLGVGSNTITLPVEDAAPGIFTLDSTGRGLGAIVNEDFKVNTAATPAKIGSIISLYVTGEGQTTPGGIDGTITGSDLRRPILPVSVRIGGISAEVLYAGAAPQIVAGVMQVNARIPLGIVAGPAVPVEVLVGPKRSQANVSVAVYDSAPGQFVLYGVDAGQGSSTTLHRIDIDRGEAIRVGSIPYEPVTDIAFTPDGRLYGIAVERGFFGINFGSKLLELDQLTGASRVIGELGFDSPTALTADTDGTLYSATAEGEFLRVDRGTGRATLVGSYGSGNAASGDLVFDARGILYSTLNGGSTDRLAVIDKRSGRASIIGNIGFREVYGLAFSSAGQLLAAANGESSEPLLIEIDPRTGQGRLLTTIRGTQGMYGFAAGTRTWPLGLQPLNRVMTKSVTENTCVMPSAVSVFSTQDSHAYVWFDVANSTAGDKVSSRWYSPSGTVSTVNWDPLAVGGYLCFWARLPIAGSAAAKQSGDWRVGIQWNGVDLFALPFQIR